MKILLRTLLCVLLASPVELYADVASSGEKSGREESRFCDIWLGVIKISSGDGDPTILAQKTTRIPINLPDGGPRFGWGFFQPCRTEQERCSLSFAVYGPTENKGQVPGISPIIEDEQVTPPGGRIIYFTSDDGDFLGVYRIVVKRNGETTCDQYVEIVE
jgi:hypothetical protein